MIIRDEQPQDVAAIAAVISAAFLHHPHSDQREAAIVQQLRDAGELKISLVAEEAGNVVGQIAFSEVLINGKNLGWYGLAPVAVRPDFQNRGIGETLVKTGLDRLKSLNASGCVLVGEPEYYQRFGFLPSDRLRFPLIPDEFFLVLPFREDIPSGTVEFHSAFNNA